MSEQFRPVGGSELDNIDMLLAELDAITATKPFGIHTLWDCTIAGWAAGAIRELLASGMSAGTAETNEDLAQSEGRQPDPKGTPKHSAAGQTRRG